MVRKHVVAAGETLSALALRFYGDAALSSLIAAASGITDPDDIDVGQRLIIPDFSRYTAVAGDTLSALASRFYGDAGLSWLIADASGVAENATIGVGQRLVIPEIIRYKVSAGDTLSALARRFYGDASFYPTIAAVNGIANPAVINVGPQRERFPSVVLPVPDRRRRLEPGSQRTAARWLPHQRTSLSRALHAPWR